MPTRHETTPPWGKKRKREPSTSSNSTNQSIHPPSPPPFEYRDIKHPSMESHDPRRRPTPWTKHSNPLSPSSQASNHDDLQQAAKDMFDWTRSDRPIEESLIHMERIVALCQDEAIWSGDKRWKQVLATYKSCGASLDAVQDLKDAREPFWTQCRVKHASTTIATPRALADSVRTMLAESERANGHYLDREIKAELIKAVERVFPRTQPKILILDSPEPSVSGSNQPQAPIASVAPIAQMLKADTPISNQIPASTAPQQAAFTPSDPRLASRPPGWTPGAERKPRADSLTDSSSSRTSSAATPATSSPLRPSQPSPLSNPGLSQVIKPRRLGRAAPEAAEQTPTNTQRAVPPSPSASPTLATNPIQFNIATSSNRPPSKRPRLDIDINLPQKSIHNVFSTPSSSVTERRRSSALGSNSQPPTGPRSLPLFQAKIVVPKEPFMNEARQKQCILGACDYNNIPAQDATPHPSNDRTWILHFRDLRDLQTSLGKMTILHDISTPVLTHAPGQIFQVFGIIEKPSFITSKVEVDIINLVARTFRPRKFLLLRQTNEFYNTRITRKWLVIFEQPLDRDNFTLNLKVHGVREMLNSFGLTCSKEMERCWVCEGHDHLAPHCEFVHVVKLPHQDGQYLSTTPQLR
ncbi:hypothetical protein QM012_002405 [Aureobasidium pullulans]|uniref:Uncharacterized protein n=1 Tax=Aureobasidium pullulans TaxID=5580 RepID=A0ABR0TD65_AURPU